MITLATLISDRPWGAQSLLLSLLSQRYEGKVTHVFYDNGSTPMLYDKLVNKYINMIEVYKKNFKVVVKQVPKQPVDFIRQQALDECETERILYVDSDVYMAPNLVEGMANCYGHYGSTSMHSTLGYIQPLIRDMNTTGYKGGYPELLDDASKVDSYDAAYKMYRTAFHLHPYKWVDTACVCFNTEILRKVGGFGDWSKYFGSMLGSDVWVGRKMVLNNTPGMLVSTRHVYHFIMETSRYYTYEKIKNDLIEYSLEHLIGDAKEEVELREAISFAIHRGEFDYLYEHNS